MPGPLKYQSSVGATAELKLNVAELCWQIHEDPSAAYSTNPPVPIKTVTFHDEGYLGVLFWGMKLAGVKKKKKEKQT